jgi:hypothetical protein
VGSHWFSNMPFVPGWLQFCPGRIGKRMPLICQSDWVVERYPTIRRFPTSSKMWILHAGITIRRDRDTSF